MTREEIEAWRERDQRFRQTDLGKLFYAHTSATIEYWRLDHDERVPYEKLKKLDALQREAQKALAAKLMEIAGVE